MNKEEREKISKKKRKYLKVIIPIIAILVILGSIIQYAENPKPVKKAEDIQNKPDEIKVTEEVYGNWKYLAVEGISDAIKPGFGNGADIIPKDLNGSYSFTISSFKGTPTVHISLDTLQKERHIKKIVYEVDGRTISKRRISKKTNIFQGNLTKEELESFKKGRTLRLYVSEKTGLTKIEISLMGFTKAYNKALDTNNSLGV